MKLAETRFGLTFWLVLSPDRPLDRAVLGAARLGQVAGVSVGWCAGGSARQRDGALLTLCTAAISEVTIVIGEQPAYSHTFAAIDSPRVRRRLARLDVLGWDGGKTTC